jgi:hypothetical protein
VSRLAPIVLFTLLAATQAVAQSAPDLRGTWKGESEVVIMPAAAKAPAHALDRHLSPAAAVSRQSGALGWCMLSVYCPFSTVECLS